MGPLTYVLAIMGCADGAATCQTVMTLPTVYASRAECSAATTAALGDAAALDFPTVTAECRAVPARDAAARRTHGPNRRG